MLEVLRRFWCAGPLNADEGDELLKNLYLLRPELFFFALASDSKRASIVSFGCRILSTIPRLLIKLSLHKMEQVSQPNRSLLAFCWFKVRNSETVFSIWSITVWVCCKLFIPTKSCCCWGLESTRLLLPGERRCIISLPRSLFSSWRLAASWLLLLLLLQKAEELFVVSVLSFWDLSSTKVISWLHDDVNCWSEALADSDFILVVRYLFTWRSSCLRSFFSLRSDSRLSISAADKGSPEQVWGCELWAGRPGPFLVFSFLRHFARRFWNQT